MDLWNFELYSSWFFFYQMKCLRHIDNLIKNGFWRKIIFYTKMKDFGFCLDLPIEAQDSLRSTGCFHIRPDHGHSSFHYGSPLMARTKRIPGTNPRRELTRRPGKVRTDSASYFLAQRLWVTRFGGGVFRETAQRRMSQRKLWVVGFSSTAGNTDFACWLHLTEGNWEMRKLLFKPNHSVNRDFPPHKESIRQRYARNASGMFWPRVVSLCSSGFIPTKHFQLHFGIRMKPQLDPDWTFHNFRQTKNADWD